MNYSPKKSINLDFSEIFGKQKVKITTHNDGFSITFPKAEIQNVFVDQLKLYNINWEPTKDNGLKVVLGDKLEKLDEFINNLTAQLRNYGIEVEITKE